MVIAAIDNDILLKASCYGLLDDLLTQIPAGAAQCGFLGAAPYVIGSAKCISKRCENIERAGRLLKNYFDTATPLEPTEEEMDIASALELYAQRAAVNLDVGESLLVAIVLSRELNWLVTGDKRAIKAMACLQEEYQPLLKINGKVICLEMLFSRLLDNGNSSEIRETVCHEPSVDCTLNICFCCQNQASGYEQWREGLVSYINSLKAEAPNLLAD